VRLFVGIALTSGVQGTLESWLNGLRSAFPHLRWSPPEQWHVTLQFLGETDEARYACTIERLRGIDARAVDIQLEDPGFFERAGVFHLAVRATASLIALHYETQDAFDGVRLRAGSSRLRAAYYAGPQKRERTVTGFRAAARERAQSAIVKACLVFGQGISSLSELHRSCRSEV
jgi:2'-5' RNA ligase